MRKYAAAAMVTLLLLCSYNVHQRAALPPDEGADGAAPRADLCWAEMPPANAPSLHQSGEREGNGSGAGETAESGAEAQGGASGAGGSAASGAPGQGAGAGSREPTANGAEAAPIDAEAIYIQSLINGMSLEEQVSQMFVLRLGAGTDGPSDALESFVVEAGAGGYVLFSDNITTYDGTRALTDAIRESSAIAPFICIDEEGGTVSRLRSGGLPGYAAQPSARAIGATGDAGKAFLAGEAIGEALSRIGADVDFAPVADVLTNPRNAVVGSRSFGADPALVAEMASAFQAGLKSHDIMAAPKHFPGHGNTTDDSHVRLAVTASDMDHLAAVEYVPFARLISEGAEFIMAGHISAPYATTYAANYAEPNAAPNKEPDTAQDAAPNSRPGNAPDIEPGELPATLSRYFLTDVLRDGLRFGGVVITDAMDMGAITRRFGPAEAAVMAVLAGADMILMPEDYGEAKDGILDAIGEGALSRERIGESLARIFRAKIGAQLIMIQ